MKSCICHCWISQLHSAICFNAPPPLLIDFPSPHWMMYFWLPFSSAQEKEHAVMTGAAPTECKWVTSIGRMFDLENGHGFLIWSIWMKRLQSGSDFQWTHIVKAAAHFSSKSLPVFNWSKKRKVTKKTFLTILTISFRCRLVLMVFPPLNLLSIFHMKLKNSCCQQLCWQPWQCSPGYNHIFMSHDFCNAGDNLRAS